MVNESEILNDFPVAIIKGGIIVLLYRNYEYFIITMVKISNSFNLISQWKAKSFYRYFDR